MNILNICHPSLLRSGSMAGILSKPLLLMPACDGGDAPVTYGIARKPLLRRDDGGDALPRIARAIKQTLLFLQKIISPIKGGTSSASPTSFILRIKELEGDGLGDAPLFHSKCVTP